MWPLRTILFFIMFWGGGFAALMNPIWGVATYLMAYQMNPPRTWWGAPLVDIGMRFSFVAVLFIIVGMITGRRRVPKTESVITPWEMGVVLLVVLAILCAVFGVGYGARAHHGLEKFWKLQVFVLILARLASTRQNLTLVFWAIAAGCGYIGYDAYTAPYRAFLLGRLERLGGSDIGTSSGASAHLAAMLPIIGVVFLTCKMRILKVLAAVFGALSFNAIVLCRTRSAFMGLAAGAVVAVIAAPKAKRLRIFFLLALALGGSYVLSDKNYRERMATLGSKETLSKDQATLIRVDLLKISQRMLADHPFGVGLGNFSWMVGKYDRRYTNRSPHNTIALAFCEMGFLGGLLFLAIVFESFRLLYRSVKLAPLTDSPNDTRYMLYGCLISLVCYLVSGLATERFSCESFWWVLVFPVCLNRMVMRESAARARVPALAQSEPLQETPPLLGSPQYGV